MTWAVFVGCEVNESIFQDYLQYVSDYIKFTQNYKLPTDNSYMYVENNPNTTIIGEYSLTVFRTLSVILQRWKNVYN